MECGLACDRAAGRRPLAAFFFPCFCCPMDEQVTVVTTGEAKHD